MCQQSYVEQPRQENLPSWRALETVVHIRDVMKLEPTRIKVSHVNRIKAAPAHYMANWARVKRDRREGLNYEDIIPASMDIRVFDPGI
jgi:hypothetical protein